MRKHSNAFFQAVSVLVVGMFVISSAGCGKKADAPAKIETPMAATAAAPEVKVPVEKQEVPVPSTKPITESRTFYDFENDLQGWEIPLWTEGKTDYVAKEIAVSKDFASKGTASMKITGVYPGNAWSAGLVEIQQYLDLSAYRVISVDLYLPKDAPIGLKAMLILTVGDNWKFVEMNSSIPLIPGEWVTLNASIEPGSYDWKRVVPNEEFAKDVRKVAVRIESNRKPQYTGPVYVDNIRAGR